MDENKREFFEEYKKLCLKYRVFIAEHWMCNHSLFIRSQNMGSLDLSGLGVDEPIDDDTWTSWIENHLTELKKATEDI